MHLNYKHNVNAMPFFYYRAVLLNPVGFTVFHVLSVLIGLVVFAYYINIGCDPLKSGIITNSNQVIMSYKAKLFPPGYSSQLAQF